jgi:hypothetical protein
MAEFKKCSCGCRWKSREDFIGDPNIKMLGLQESDSMTISDMYLFNHSCHNTIAVGIHAFAEPYAEG